MAFFMRLLSTPRSPLNKTSLTSCHLALSGVGAVVSSDFFTAGGGFFCLLVLRSVLSCFFAFTGAASPPSSSSSSSSATGALNWMFESPHLGHAKAPSLPMRSPLLPEAPHELHCQSGSALRGAGANFSTLTAFGAAIFARRSATSSAALVRIAWISSISPGSSFNFSCCNFSSFSWPLNLPMSRSFFCSDLNFFSVSSSMSRPRSPGAASSASARACAWTSSLQ
mmetsp:Transcript_28542/g.86180  ORF Transcript_28542/g.86180 Transcript_28542/m.86180 type:complete len:225 (-) Transcript_28542:12-686(-)